MTNISPEEIKQRKEAGEDLHLLDVRELAENQEFNIGGTLFPLGKIQGMETEEIEIWKEEEVICYCRSGSRSMMAAMFLEQLGFSNVKNMVGGIISWQEKFGQ